VKRANAKGEECLDAREHSCASAARMSLGSIVLFNGGMLR